MNARKTEKGSIFAYILAALVLLGALIMTLTGGPQKSQTTVQLDTLANGIYGDVNAVVSIINDCALNYSTPADVNSDGSITTADNPNAPFPLYDVAGTKGASGGTGIAIDFNTNNIVCPGASPTTVASMPVLFTPRNIGSLSTLNNTATYTVHYRNETGAGKEGVMLRVTRAASDPLWEEAAARVSSRYSACKAFYVKNGAVDGAACTNGCLFFWVLRLSTSAIGTTDDSGASCPPP
jgi:hypothetical protein